MVLFFSPANIRHHVFCILQFVSSTSSSISLCMSAYGLAQNVHEPWAWQNYTITSCIIVTVLVNALKDALTSNPKIFMNDKEICEQIVQQRREFDINSIE